METLTSLSERIVPGSTRAKVAPFVDQLLAVDTPDNQRKFLAALGWIDAEAAARYNHPWKALTEGQQTELLTAVSTAEPAEPPTSRTREVSSRALGLKRMSPSPQSDQHGHPAVPR